MSDLIKRLRDTNRCTLLPVCDDAADEIERLTAERDSQQRVCISVMAERDAFKQTVHDELDANLRLRELGGARADETMTAFLERVIAERDALRADAERMKQELESCRQSQ